MHFWYLSLLPTKRSQLAPSLLTFQPHTAPDANHVIMGFEGCKTVKEKVVMHVLWESPSEEYKDYSSYEKIDLIYLDCQQAFDEGVEDCNFLIKYATQDIPHDGDLKKAIAEAAKVPVEDLFPGFEE